MRRHLLLATWLLGLVYSQDEAAGEAAAPPPENGTAGDAAPPPEVNEVAPEAAAPEVEEVNEVAAEAAVPPPDAGAQEANEATLEAAAPPPKDANAAAEAAPPPREGGSKPDAAAPKAPPKPKADSGARPGEKVLNLSIPQLSDEESQDSNAMPFHMKCDSCMAVAFQISKAIQEAKSKNKMKGTDEELDDLFEGICNKTYFSDYGIKEITQGEKKHNKLSGPGLRADAIAGALVGGGTWPSRLVRKCEETVGHLTERYIWDQYTKAETKPGKNRLAKFICRDDCRRRRADDKRKDRNDRKRSARKQKLQEQDKERRNLKKNLSKEEREKLKRKRKMEMEMKKKKGEYRKDGPPGSASAREKYRKAREEGRQKKRRVKKERTQEMFVKQKEKFRTKLKELEGQPDADPKKLASLKKRLERMDAAESWDDLRRQASEERRKRKKEEGKIGGPNKNRGRPDFKRPDEKKKFDRSKLEGRKKKKDIKREKGKGSAPFDALKKKLAEKKSKHGGGTESKDSHEL